MLPIGNNSVFVFTSSFGEKDWRLPAIQPGICIGFPNGVERERKSDYLENKEQHIQQHNRLVIDARLSK
ncbi:hypothetical protein P872_04200 [Rhodonellum psychrophilum GCM71 = DSM 17998]|uniref:Uncharacterized protein n=1 Tax=Rhodonellum psychrophilum GCM71 = DSM 17998 TaxID=1123057 RepID=U5C1B8_9BACT|nr:hypothetical protein P872_04200 [Rhodonellum psychrophilum GCM71 = DSM 17998]